MCFGSNEKVLAIGDNLRTDIKGANNLKIDCIFISEGVHRKEFKNFSELNKLLEKYDVKANFFQKRWPIAVGVGKTVNLSAADCHLL